MMIEGLLGGWQDGRGTVRWVEVTERVCLFTYRLLA